MGIQIRQRPAHPIATVNLFTPEGVFLGTVDKWQLLDVRIQIGEKKLDGYYFKYINLENQEKTITIDNLGRVSEWDEDLLDRNETLEQTRKLRSLQLGEI